MSMHAERLAGSLAEADLMALRRECDVKRAEHEAQSALHGAKALLFADLTAEIDAKLGDLGALSEFMDSVRSALAAGESLVPPLRVVREDNDVCDAAESARKPIAFKGGSISAAILALMEADAGRTEPWSVSQVTEVLQETVGTSRSRVGANLEHIFQRGALVKVLVPEDRAHVYFKIGAPWTVVD